MIDIDADQPAFISVQHCIQTNIFLVSPQNICCLSFHSKCQCKVLLWNNYNMCFYENNVLVNPAPEDPDQGPVVQSIVSLTSSLRVISLTLLADSIHSILIFFAEKMWVAFALQKLLTFFQQNISAYLCITCCKF